MTSRMLRFCPLLIGLSAFTSGCALTEPWERDGMWNARGVNNGNLAAQIVDPHDLVAGKSDTYTDGALAAAAVDRLYTGKVKALPTATLATVQTGNPASPGGGSGSGGSGQ